MNALHLPVRKGVNFLPENMEAVACLILGHFPFCSKGLVLQQLWGTFSFKLPAPLPECLMRCQLSEQKYECVRVKNSRSKISSLGTGLFSQKGNCVNPTQPLFSRLVLPIQWLPATCGYCPLKTWLVQTETHCKRMSNILTISYADHMLK